MKKFLALVLALVMTMSLVTVGASAATDFTDDAKITNAEAVEVLNAMGVLTGYPDGSFRPEGILTRGAGAKIIAYLMLGQTAADKLKATYTVFEDVTDTVGLAAYIEWAAANGIVDGYGDGNFGPYAKLTEYAFGKMLLTALGYDSAKEGYTGAGWQKAVYRDAVAAGIFDGTEAWGACDRETAARFALGALLANVVVYGDANIATGSKLYWNDHEVIGTGTVTVNGRYETTKEMWRFYPGLTYTKTAEDLFERPGHAWTYTPASFDKFYMDAPVAEYTTKVSECDLLVKLGIAKTSTAAKTLAYYKNGVAVSENTELKHGATCTTFDQFGGQGTLTQVFKSGTGYIVTEISTYLAKVLYSRSAAHSANVTQSVLDVYGIEGNLTVNGVALTKGDYVLVNVEKADDTDAYTLGAYKYDTNKYLAVVGNAATFEGKMTTCNLNADPVVRTIAGSVYADAAEYTLGYLPAPLTNYTWFVDQYGNVIGNAPISTDKVYGRIDALKWVHDGPVNSKEYASANLVTAAGTVVTEAAVELASWNVALTGSNVEDESAKNAGYYNNEYSKYGVVKYDVTDGVYSAETVGEVLHKWTQGFPKADSVENKNIELGYYFNEKRQLVEVMADDDTQFLVLAGYTAAGAEIYEAYTGVANLPTMSRLSAIVAVVEEETLTVDHEHWDAYAEFVYIDAHNAIRAGSTVEAYVFSDTTGNHNYGDKLVTYTVWVNGVMTEITAFEENFKLFPTNGKGEFEPGVYNIEFNAAGNAVKATKSSAYTDAKVESVGTNAVNKLYAADATVYIVGTNEITAGSLADINEAVTVTYGGTTTTYTDYISYKPLAADADVIDVIYLWNDVQG